MNGSGVLRGLAARGSTVHLMGIGGAGMAGLALLLQSRGAQVTGCDLASNEMTADLKRRGITVQQGHAVEHVDGADVLVHTAAVPPGHPELQAARDRGLVVIKRSEALADLVNEGKLIAVSGTHGKTTTAAMTALVLEAAGADPTALVGGRVSAWAGNARIGAADTFVVEADEYDRSFLALWPYIAVVTSVEAEHVDTYASVADLEAAFDEFAGRVPQDGRLIACADDPGARRRLDRAGERGLGYGLGGDADLRGESVSLNHGGVRFDVFWESEPLGAFELGVPGEHNVRNALAALGVLLAMDGDPRKAAPALARFAGVERRFQRLGEVSGVVVIDDYAHHPTEVVATLAAARQAFSGRRLVVAFQPHLFSRTRAFADDFGRALAAADVAYVTAIYPARETPVAGVTAEMVLAAAREVMDERTARYVDDLDELGRVLIDELREGDVLVTLGAGDITRVAHTVAAELVRRDVDA